MTYDEIMAMTDDELDCAAAVAHGWYLSFDKNWWLSETSSLETSPHSEILFIDYHPSTNGNQLLEIMAREKISANFEFDGCWSADNYTFDQAEQESTALGNTINQAVLRCYLASQQGGKQW